MYTCVEDAVKRRDYLATFDGGIFANGTHTVIGTVLVRTSNELTATQQKDLEAKLITALTYLPEIDKNDSEPSKPDDTTVPPTTTPDTTPPTTNTTEPDDKKENEPPVTVQPVDRKQAAVAETIKQANRWFPIDRHFIEYILVNPSLEEGFEPYTEEEAAYAIANANIDWKKHALYNAIEVLEANPGIDFSQQDVRDFVQDSGGYCGCAGYTDDELQYAVDNCGIDWNSKAINAMREYWNNDYSVIVTLYDFYDYLAGLGYDDTTIEYALSNTSGYYRGEATANDEERVKLLLSYGYTREAIINWYSEIIGYSEAEALVDSCL